MSHHYRDADIAWLTREGFDGRSLYGEKQEWGIIERDRQSGELVALEFWRAGERLPRELLDALPEPDVQGVVVTRQDLAKRQAA